MLWDGGVLEEGGGGEKGKKLTDLGTILEVRSIELSNGLKNVGWRKGESEKMTLRGLILQPHEWRCQSLWQRVERGDGCGKTMSL